MPLAEDSSLGTGWLEHHKEMLASFTENIRSCIEHSEWSKLTLMLESRHAYLEKLFSESIPKSCLDEVVLLAQSIMEQDQVFKIEVEQKKATASQMQLSLGRGRRATQLYNVVQT